MANNIVLSTLISAISFNEIKKRLIQLYPNQKKCIEGYKHVYCKLLCLKSKKSKLKLIIETIKDEDGDYVDVSGKEGKQIYAIEFTPWAEWLGMNIDVKTLKLFSKVDIVCHALWEMTFVGWEEEDVSGFMKEMQKRVKEVKSGKAKLVSYDEVFDKK